MTSDGRNATEMHRHKQTGTVCLINLGSLYMSNQAKVPLIFAVHSALDECILNNLQ